MKSRLVISSAVRTALKNHEPVVALESTILTHGLPRPTNLEVAQRCEAAVKSSGSVPATIFLYKGKIHIGASEEELFELCQCDDAVKVSRRDFAKVLSGSGWGGTTIAGTVLAANLAGIDLMATGGLGGVHRGAEVSFDISADLSELGRTPVAVVSSGVKKILDVQKTLEVLETQGVGTYTIGDSAAFPDFYMRDSGLKSHGGAISIEEAGRILAVNKEVGISSGIVFANPVPKDAEGDGIFISGLIDEALHEAERQNITGPASTPFILSKLAELSGGKTVEINVRLVENNCLVGGQIAKEFALQRNSCAKHPFISQPNCSEIVIFGTANMDTIWKLDSKARPRGASNYATVQTNVGGVGANLAIAVARSDLSRRPTFITTLGDDSPGAFLEDRLARELDLIKQDVKEGSRSGQYMCVVEDDGEIHVAAQDMEISNQFAIDTEVKRRIESSKTILLDFNLKPNILERICAIGRESNKTILADPTSLFRIPEREAVIRLLDFYFPNLAELIVTEMQMTKGEVDFDEAQRVESSWLAEPSKLGLNIKNCCENLRKSGVNCELLVTAAEHGVFHVEDTVVVHYPLISSVNWEKVPRGDPVHVNGCGDTFTGCFVAQLSKGELSKEELIKAALTASQISLRSVQNISPVIDF